MDLPPVLPVMTLPGVTLFPNSMIPLHIFEPRYRAMLRTALHTHRMFILALRRPNSQRETPCRVAGVGLIRASVQNKNGTSNLILQGIGRVHLHRAVRYRPFRAYEVEAMATSGAERVATQALAARTLELVAARLELGFKVPTPLLDRLAKAIGKSEGSISSADVVQHGLEFLSSLSDNAQLADLVACTLLPNPLERQIILETADVELRFRHLIHFLSAEVDRIRDQES